MTDINSEESNQNFNFQIRRCAELIRKSPKFPT